MVDLNFDLFGYHVVDNLILQFISCHSQIVVQFIGPNFDFDYSVEWNDTSDSSETDKIDFEENEQEKQLKQHYFIRPKSTFFSKNFTSYQIKRQPIVSIDIHLPPPEEDNT